MWKKLVKPRVLIVEDNPEQREGIKFDLETISTKMLKGLGIDHFIPDLAQDIEEAEKFFLDAKTNNIIYDFLLLDLGLPKKIGGEDLPEYGQRLFETARKEGIAREIVIISVWREIHFVAPVFRSGAIDFIAKPFISEVLQTRILECWKRSLVKRSNRYLYEDRINNLVPYAEKGLARMFTKSFHKFAEAINESSKGLEKYVKDRYRLDRDRDTDDAFFTHLDLQKESLSRIRVEFEKLQNTLLPVDDDPKPKNVGQIIKNIHTDLLPCLIIKNANFKFRDKGIPEVLSFEDNVQAVLREIITGAIKDLEDFSENESIIDIEVEVVDQHVKVKVMDDLKPISSGDAKEINEGSSISPDLRFEREWGLSVVQHIAQSDFGHLEIEPREKGNTISYFIPLTA